MGGRLRIVSPSIEVIFHLPEGYTPEQFLESAGRTCYKSEDHITEESADKFIGMLANRGHWAMLEHAVASARLVCDRGVTHELVRHRLASFAQESTRYCDYSEEKFGATIAVITPEGMDDGSNGSLAKFTDPEDYLPILVRDVEEVLEALHKGQVRRAECMLKGLKDIAMDETGVWAQAMRWANQSYQKMRVTGSPAQRARHVLPIGVKSEIVITANLREWQHIFQLRCAKTAHPHIRGLMLQALEVFAKKIPAMFQKMWMEMGGKEEVDGN